MRPIHASDAAKILHKDINEIFALVSKGFLVVINGQITEESLMRLKTSSTGQSTQTAPKKPEEKPNRRYNPSGIHTFINYGGVEEFVAMMGDLGEDISHIPRGYMFGGLVEILKRNTQTGESLFERWSNKETLESFVKEIYPVKNEHGHTIQDNLWLIRGAETYFGWDEKTKLGIKKIIDDSNDDIDFTYSIKDLNGDVMIPASAFLMALEGTTKSRRRFIPEQTLERFKWLGQGLEIYRNISKELKQELSQAYEEFGGDFIDFSHYLFNNNIFDKLSSLTKKPVEDDNAYLSAILFAIKDNVKSLELNLGLQHSIERSYSSLRRMQRFKEKGRTFTTAVNKIKKDIESSIADETFDSDLFIANTIKNRTYEYFYNHYCGRGIQYSTFINYATAAFLIVGKDRRDCGEYCAILSSFARERKAEKVDRLRGKDGRTSLVDLSEKAASYKEVYEELRRNWKEYQQVLSKEGCWLKTPRREPFSMTEVKGMHTLIRRFPGLFLKK